MNIGMVRVDQQLGYESAQTGHKPSEYANFELFVRESLVNSFSIKPRLRGIGDVLKWQRMMPSSQI